jgi:predicted AlkP superfamily pyrophosphatase or phosphodiesterase
VNGLGENDVVGRKTLEVIEEFRNDRFFLFVHFADVDHQGHKHGENSKEYNDALVSCDAWTGRIVQKLRDLGLYDRTLVYVTADHGFDEDRTGHSDAPYVFLATNDAGIKRRGQREDITPTILHRLGVDLTRISPRLDGRSLLSDDDTPSW